MHKIFLVFFAILYSCIAYPQNNTIDSLQKVMLIQKNDTSRVNTLNGIADSYFANSDYKSAFQFSEKALALAKEINYIKGSGNAYFRLGQIYSTKANFTEAIKYFSYAVDAVLKTGNKKNI